jgi:hypothetical protein
MNRLAAWLLAALVGLPGLASAQASTPTDAELLAIGKRIYRDGVLPSGELLRGVGEAGVVLSGDQAACEACHRRSGYGSSEGPIEVRPITGPALFGERVAPSAPGSAAPAVAAVDETGMSPAEAARARAEVMRKVRAAQFAGKRPRPVYDEASLARSLRDGVDVTGRHMNASMPRYVLDPVAQAALTAYLKTLSAQVSPGVTDDVVHFATVIQPGTDPARRRALLDVLETFVKDRNLGLRDQVQRELGGSKRLQRSYREWVLHVWDLTGPSDTWGAQLEAQYEAQPVFALMSGLGNASWRPIHDFSERFEVPCIFPQVDVPVLAERDFYTVYLSRGITLEAQALARFLGAAGERGPVLQVYRRSEASAAGADAFRRAWADTSGSAPKDLVLDRSPDDVFWQQLAAQAAGATLVLWLSPQDLAHAQALGAAGSPVKAIYLSASLNAGRRTGLAAEGDGRVRLIYPQDVPAVRDARLEVVKRWLHSNGIEPGDEKVQMNAYLAATVTGMLVTHSKDTYSREFLVERMEHRLGTALELSIYPRLSLGPGQRYASKGSYIVAVGGPDDRQLKPVSDWIVP